MFSKSEADRILKRAAEIEGADDARPLTVEELRSIAGEAGFGSSAVERAIAEAKQLAPRSAPPQPVHRSGTVFTRLSTSRTVPVELSSEQLMQAIRLFQPYREGSVQIRLDEDRLTWRDKKGLIFTMWSGGGVTEIQVFVSKILIRRGRWMGWVQLAADRLEALTLLVAARGVAAPVQID
jgi:hypothetical protein